MTKNVEAKLDPIPPQVHTEGVKKISWPMRVTNEDEAPSMSGLGDGGPPKKGPPTDSTHCPNLGT